MRELAKAPVIKSLVLGTALLLSLPAPGLLAQEKDVPANPSLKARVEGVNDASAVSKDLKIGTMETKVSLRGMIAETTLTIRFDNPSRQTLEGEFNLDMPLGSVVTGYALDIEGTMVDGVLVPPHQARVAYEQRVSRRVDPGIVEVSQGSRFSTRVFPIFPGRGRTIRLSFVTPLDPVKGYVLPFGSSVSAESFKLSIANVGSGAGAAPDIGLPRGMSGKWGETGLQWEGKSVQLGGQLTIKPREIPAITLSEHRGEGRFFDIVDRAPAQQSAKAATGQRVSILWDRSRSRKQNDLAREIAFLESWMERTKPASVKLIQFDSSSAEVVEIKDAPALKAALKATNYGGATSFSKINAAMLAGTETCLMFSDGLTTLGARSGFAPACRLFALTSTRDSDRAYLGSRARRSGGELIDLSATSTDDALAQIGLSAPKVVKVTDAQGAAIEAAVIDGGPSGWRIIGEAPTSGDIIVTLSGLGAGLSERRYSLPMSAPTFNGPGALWAADAIGSNAADRKTAELLKIARRYSVASPIASFIVLETPNDYADAGIEPPASYNKQQREVYNSLRAQLDAQLAARQKTQTTTVRTAFLARKNWWTSPKVATPPVPPRPRPGTRRPNARNVPMPMPEPVMAPPPVPLPPAPPPPARVSVEEAPPEPVSAASREIIVTGAARQGTGSSNRSRRQESAADAAGAAAEAGPQRNAGRGGTIAVEQWQSDRPYIAALDAAPSASFATVFAAQEEKYGALPAFYLDVSNWLDAKGRRAEAIRMVTSALDLPTKNNDTLQVVAARLTRLGDLDSAVWLLDQLVELEPERPQPLRTLALALIQRATMRKDGAKADLQRAFDLLAKVVNSPWDGRFPSIEQIALNDANAIAARLTALGGSTKAIDPTLLTMLDTDIRIVVEWNTKATDMDLWVDEPDDERVIYSHNRSAKGGFLSPDFTQGYGPEEYFIRKAIPGSYTIRMNTFSTDRLNPNGPTTVTGRIYRNFGRANQTEQIIDIEVLPGSQGERKLGVVTVVK